MRSYGQYCSVAKALDLIGDRWNLLIVRELLLLGPARYTDLLGGLPGIASNLLVERLRALEQAGILSRTEAPPPVATALFELTPRGRELEPVLTALGEWGVPLMAEPPAGGEAFRSHWLAFPVGLFLSHREPGRAPITIELRVEGEPVTVTAVDGEVHTNPGAAEDPDLLLAGTPGLLLAVLSGRLGIEDARRKGLRCDGDPHALRRLQDPARIAA